MTVWRRPIQALWWKHRIRAYFGYVCTHTPIQMRNKVSGVSGPKFAKCLTESIFTAFRANKAKNNVFTAHAQKRPFKSFL